MNEVIGQAAELAQGSASADGGGASVLRCAVKGNR
jgi:hypothetical protein